MKFNYLTNIHNRHIEMNMIVYNQFVNEEVRRLQKEFVFYQMTLKQKI